MTPWGAFPGHTRTDIGSGVGFAHQPPMFEAVQKSVIRSPFRAWPKPPWFASHRSPGRLGPELIRDEAARSPLRLVSIEIEAQRG